jgi:di/tricarboxylate transporter
MAGAVSAFLTNTTVTAILMSPVIGISRKARISPSRLLIPLAFASILGGTCTLIGTSTNIAVSGYIERAGMKPLSLFEIAPVGVIALGAGILYMLVVGKRLLPDREDESLTEEYHIREYLSEIVVLPDSHLIGQRTFESDLSKLEMRILEVIRGDEKFLPDARTQIHSGDILLVEGKAEDLLKVKETAGIEIKADMKLGDRDLQTDDIKIAEVLITPQSELIGHTLKELNFRQRYGPTALAIYRHGQSLRDKIGRVRLRIGDLLLVQGTPHYLESLRRQPGLYVIEELSPFVYRKRKAIYTIALFAAAILTGGMGWLPLSVSFLAAATLTLLFRCITVEDAYRFIDWRLIIMIGGMTAFGVAMDKTGAAQFLANGIVTHLAPHGTMVVLAGFFAVTVLLTQPMSNAAAALVVLPVALTTAESLGLNGRTFAISVMLAASVSLVAPFEPSCVLVYGPGKYKFIDFIKTGGWLTLLLMAIILTLIPVFWPLEAGQ